MFNDEEVTNNLIPVLDDAADGFMKAADHIETSKHSSVAPTFRRYSAQRSRFADELRGLAAQNGDQIHETGSVAGVLHRG